MTMHVAVTIDIQALIDERPLSRFQKMVILAGFCLIALDGYDLTCMGFIAPALKAQWQLSNLAPGLLLSAGFVGLCIGALTVPAACAGLSILGQERASG